MNEIIHDYNGMGNTKSTGRTDEHFQTLARQIDHWEEQSVAKIRQTAKELRQELAMMAQQHQQVYRERLGHIAKQLSDARQNGDFFEQDLQQWTQQLHSLQKVLLEQQNIDLYQSDAPNSYITKISFFKRKNDKTKPPVYVALPKLTHSKTINHPLENCTNLTVPGEYSSGDHLFRFKMEYNGPNTLLVVGIVSATSPGEDAPQGNPTFYGWCADNLVYLRGVAHADYKGYKHDIGNNDTFQLTLDCQQQIIRLINERTRRTDELTVDLEKCPLPWKPHVRLLLNSTN